LIPACILELQQKKVPLISQEAKKTLHKWLRATMERANLIKKGRFLAKGDFKAKGYLGSGGLARFRDRLWVAASSEAAVPRLKSERLAELASACRAQIRSRIEATR